MPTPSPAALPPNEPRGFRRLWRTVKQVFHEVVGAMFAVLALGWLNSAFRAWTRDVAYWLIAMAVAVDRRLRCVLPSVPFAARASYSLGRPSACLATLDPLRNGFSHV